MSADEYCVQMRSARLVIGAHGGALSNLIFAPQNAGEAASWAAFFSLQGSELIDILSSAE